MWEVLNVRENLLLMDERGRGMRCLRAGGIAAVLRRRATHRLAPVSILLLRMGCYEWGSPAQGGTIDEEQGKFGSFPGFRVFSVFPYRCNTRFGSVDRRCEFIPAAAACYCKRIKACGSSGYRQGDPGKELHT